MPVTDIKVYGYARAARTPDRAELRLQVNKWGRDWESIHRSVTAEVAALTDTIARLGADHPQAVYEHLISQISQKSWTDNIGPAYSETVDVTATFTDFQVMSDWVFRQSSDTVHIMGIEWGLSVPARNEMSIALSVEAMYDARRKAETYAVAAGLTILGIRTLADPGLVTQEEAAPATPAPTVKPTPKTGTPSDSIDITPAPIETEVRIAVHFVAEPDIGPDVPPDFAPDVAPAMVGEDAPAEAVPRPTPTFFSAATDA
jgi:uncharacterized protein YggE